MLTDLDRTLAEHACARLAIAYALCADSRDIDGFADLWSDDGVWHNSRGALTGPAAIRQYLENAPKTSLGRHVCSNILVTVVDAQHATGISYFTFYNSAEPGAERPAAIAAPMLVGQYVDLYVKTHAGWRFASRRMEPVFKFD
jgi:hypothetical protein